MRGDDGTHPVGPEAHYEAATHLQTLCLEMLPVMQVDSKANKQVERSLLIQIESR